MSKVKRKGDSLDDNAGSDASFSSSCSFSCSSSSSNSIGADSTDEDNDYNEDGGFVFRRECHNIRQKFLKRFRNKYHEKRGSGTGREFSCGSKWKMQNRGSVEMENAEQKHVARHRRATFKQKPETRESMFLFPPRHGSMSASTQTATMAPPLSLGSRKSRLSRLSVAPNCFSSGNSVKRASVMARNSILQTFTPQASDVARGAKNSRGTVLLQFLVF